MLFTIPVTEKEDTLSPILTKLIDDALVSFTTAEYAKGRGSGIGDVAKKRIGSGYIGVECARQLAYRFHKADKEDRDSVVSRGELQRHAEAGHWTEEKTAEWLRLSGFDIKTEKSDGRQFGYMSCPDENGQFQIAGEIDGVILGGPSELPYPLLWESKKATDKKFKKFIKGVAKADSTYYGQLQTNMLEMQVHNTLFSMLNLDTMKYYFELVEFDPAIAQDLQNRAANVIKSSCPEELPRITSNESDFRCKFCDFQNRCWQKSEVKKSEPSKPFWL